MAPKTETAEQPEEKATTEQESFEGLPDTPQGSDNLPVPAAPSALDLPTEDEWEGVDTGYLGHGAVGPQLPLLQSDMRPGGGWLDTMTGAKLTSLDIVWLAWTESRAYWALPFGQGPELPDCRSANTLHPDDASPNRQAASCAECPRSKWNGEDPPACALRVNVLAYLVDERRLTRLSFGGTALKHVSRYIGGLRGMLPARPPMAVVTRVELEEKDDGKMRWLEPRFSIAAPVAFAEARPLIQLRDEFTRAWQSLLAEDLSQRDAGAEHVRPGPGPFDDAVDTSSSAGDPGPAGPSDDDAEEPF